MEACAPPATTTSTPPSRKQLSGQVANQIVSGEDYTTVRAALRSTPTKPRVQQVSSTTTPDRAISAALWKTPPRQPSEGHAIVPPPPPPPAALEVPLVPSESIERIVTSQQQQQPSPPTATAPAARDASPVFARAPTALPRAPTPPYDPDQPPTPPPRRSRQASTQSSPRGSRSTAPTTVRVGHRYCMTPRMPLSTRLRACLTRRHDDTTPCLRLRTYLAAPARTSLPPVAP